MPVIWAHHLVAHRLQVDQNAAQSEQRVLKQLFHEHSGLGRIQRKFAENYLRRETPGLVEGCRISELYRSLGLVWP